MGKLDRYREKRDFDATPEPSSVGRPSDLALRYSIQKHAARRTHFDLRLEWDGGLLSWAITRGPSLQTSERRLAVRTEDHPLPYLDFEGTIPRGNYGAGTVMLWDIGHWQPVEPMAKGLKKGHVRFRIHGARLTGEWHLIRLKDEDRENWLLTKADDDVAGARDPVDRYRRSVKTNRTMRQIAAGSDPVDTHDGERPGFRKPQLATLGEGISHGDGWWHELKFDGYRALIALGRGGPRVFTRTGKDWTDRFASLLPALGEVDCDSALIDGEIVAGAGLDGFSTLQKAISAGGPFRFYAFDILERDGTDLAGRSLKARRQVLEELWKPVPPEGPAQLSLVIHKNAEAAFDTICSAGGEGLIAKRIDAPYRSERVKSWRKIKCRRREEFAVIGWQKSDKAGRPFASLLLGLHRAGGWQFIGKVGTGFDAETMEEISGRLKPLARKSPPAKVTRSEAKGVQWVTPRLVAEVEYAEMTDDGRVRHATFQGLREDKMAREVDASDQEGDRVQIAGIGLSSPDRVVFPGSKITKLDVARYLEAMAGPILETAADRPLSLVRLPEGLDGERFFQRHAGKGFPDALKTIEIEESDGEMAPYMYVADAAGLVGAAQMGTMEFHIWGSRRDRLERPDRLVFDLDPDEGLKFADVKSAAIEIRDLLGEIGFGSFPLLSGGKGIHVVVPLRRTAGWETVKLFSRVFALLLAQRSPERYVAEMSKAKRKGRIFIDWLRNERGATAIAPFSPRARPGAPVAVPVAWDELSRIRKADAFNIHRARDRSWSDLAVPDLSSVSEAAIERLERAFG